MSKKKKKNKNHGKIRKGIVSIKSVLEVIDGTRNEEECDNGLRRKVERSIRHLFLEESVKTAGLRLETFKVKGTVCVGCNLQASFFAVERNYRDTTYHLNLYGIKDGENVLFTKDHIVAKVNGGENKLSNTQTMCCTCNVEKGDK